MFTPIFKAVACHRCTALYRPDPAYSRNGDPSHRSVLTNGRRLCPKCREMLGDVADQPLFSSPRRWHAAGTLSGESRDLVTALKYRNRTAAVAILADRLVNAIAAEHKDRRVQPHSGVADFGFDVVTWAPTSARRRRRRGYDQSELLAHAVARRLGLPCRRLLFRDRSGHQTGRSRQERVLLGPVFTARPLRKPSRVLVIDDVVTTGSTLRAAGHALELAGAAKVVLFAAVATPHHRTSPSPPLLDPTLINPSGSPSRPAIKKPSTKKPATKNRVTTGQQVA